MVFIQNKLIEGVKETPNKKTTKEQITVLIN